jgi:putative hydrolase of the HAD superfamily
MSHRALLTDFGGVLTSDVFVSFNAFCKAEGLEPDRVRHEFVSNPRARKLLEDLECGRLDEAGFEPAFAELLGVEPDDLINRLFAGMQADAAMLDAVRTAREAGVRTGLLSNSWTRSHYDDEALGHLFDAIVISGDEGMRKPDPEIYVLAVERLGVDPSDTVYVDDLGFNLGPARALGMATVHHRTASETIPQLESLLGVTLRT